MESWNSVINAALLGTEKKSLKEGDVDSSLSETVALIAEGTTDREEAFLQTAAVVYNLRQCGFLPLHKEAVSIATADAEEKAYASPLAHAVLFDVLEMGSISLLRFWLEQCSSANRVVQPEAMPALLNVGVKTKNLQTLLTACCGKRGEWLQQFNPEWQWYKAESGEELWQTGSLPQRKAYLAQLRKNDPANGRELLQQTWPQEPAATKVELLEAFATIAGADDVAWLEELLNEKSVKVREGALAILKTIPSSAIVQQYWRILQQSVRIVTSKGLLGIGSKTILELKLIGVEDAILKTGIQSISDQKGVRDEDFVLWQLIEQVPPSFWEEHLGLEREEIIRLLFKQKEAKELIGAVKKAAVRFGEVQWMRTIIQADPSELHASAFQLLPQKEAEEYALRFLDKPSEGETIIQYLSHFPEEWGLSFTRAILPHLVRFPQRFHRNFYSENVIRFPVAVLPYLDGVPLPIEPYLQQTWHHAAEELKRLLQLKVQTAKAFTY